MKRFAALLERLIYTPSRNRKLDILAEYFQNTPDPSRGYALASLTGDLVLTHVKANLMKQIAVERADPYLFALSHDYVGDLAETISLIWPKGEEGDLPTLAAFIETLDTMPKAQAADYIAELLDLATPNERWAIIKLVTGGLRIGVSARLAKTALSQYSGIGLEDIEKVWHGLSYPYTELFQWLDGKADKPDIHHAKVFHPMMLATAIDEEKDLAVFAPEDFIAEWKWDGIRVQIALDADHKNIFSRTGDDISAAFPDIVANISGTGVLDGELLVGCEFAPMNFNSLQQRLNRKVALKKHLDEYPAFIKLYDILFDGPEDLRDLPLEERKNRLQTWIKENPSPLLDLSQPIEFSSWDKLGTIRREGADEEGHEGIMLKRKDSVYIAGRPKGPWFKWKRDACLIDAVLMYAQRGHGKRSSFYSDFTFGVWDNGELVPIGKAYSGYTDEELAKLDKWIRNHTVNRFGPVREVEPHVVFEVAFDSAHDSPRHKSGIALRFPRINRIRWDKPATEVESLEYTRKELKL